MTYIAGLLALSTVIYLLHRLPIIKSMLDPARNLSFFKLHYMVLGMVTVMFMPDNFVSILDQNREPIMIFCLSWIGLFYGCGLELRVHQKFSPRVILFNVLEPVIVFLFVGLVVSLYLFFTYHGWEFTSVAVIIAVFSSFTVFRRSGIFHRNEEITDHPVLEELLPIGNIFPVVALCIAGIVLFGSAPVTIGSYTISGVIPLLLLNLLCGIAGGTILNMLMSGCDSIDTRSIVLLGVVTLYSGVAYVFSLSPIFVGAVSGAFLINATLKRLQVLDALNTTNKTVNRVYMFMLGTMLTPLIRILKYDMLVILLSALALFLLRGSLKYILSSIWTKRIRHKTDVSGLIWIGLTGQGILASAAVFESGLYVHLLPSVFTLIVSLLALNQLSLWVYFLYKENHTNV